MDVSAWPRILYLVGVGLLLNFDLLACTDSLGDVWFSLNGTTYQNNSLVTLEDIGEGDDALLCITNLTGVNDSASGDWYFPDGTRVFSTHNDSDIYGTRGEMVVHLNRRGGGEEGIYYCEIPDSVNVNQTIYIGVYNTNSGSPNVTDLTFDDKSRTLTCTSTGGPSTTVTWRRDGVVITLNATHHQTKRVVDPVNGTYQTVLTIDPSVGWSDIVGTYNCTVENVRGESSETVVAPGSTIVTSLTFHEQPRTLVCTSTGGPATNVTWRRRGVVITLGVTYQQTKRVVDPVNGIYQTVLTIDPSVNEEDIVGTYNCTVENDRGESSETVVVPGSPTVICLTFDDQSWTLTCTSTGGPATTVTWRKDGAVITLDATYQQTKRIVDPVNGTYQTVLTIDPSVRWSGIVGTYNCTVENDRGESSDTVVVPGDVQFSLNFTTYQNNSIVTLEDIGEGDDALLCITNLTTCCLSEFFGRWSFPNGTVVPSSGHQWDFHRTRDPMVVLMHRRRGGVEGIYYCEILDSMNVTQTMMYIGVYTSSSGSPNVTSLTYNDQSRTLTCTSTGGPATTVTWRRDGAMIILTATYQQTKRLVDSVNSTYQTMLTISSSVSQSDIVGTYNCTVENARGESSETVVVSELNTTPSQTVEVTSAPQSEEAITTTRTVPVSSSTQPTNNLPIDGATTTSVIIAVAVVIILVVIVVGVVILVVIFNTKKRKQQMEINKLQKVTTENENIQMKLKHEVSIEKEAIPSTDQLPYAEIQTEAPPDVTSKLEDLVNLNSPLTIGYSEIELEPDDSKQALPAKLPRHVTPSDQIPKATEPNPMYQNMNQHHDTLSTTDVSHGNDIYTVPDTTSSDTVDPDSSLHETVYSEPIQPSLFTDAVETPSDWEDLHPYAPIYTVPMNLPESNEVLLKVFGSNIREIHELGMGLFGKVILAETVGLSAKDLRLSESNDDKSKSTLVAVKKLKSGAPSATKETFEKEVKFMSRLTDRNVIRILGVCYEETPFIMMEYMEKGDLNQYLQKFKTLSATDSEPQGQITPMTLVHMATQIASAMKYLASHNFVHRDLATRNCLVGPNYLVKISDFGMSRSLYDSHYYHIHGRVALPVRWMAYECFYGKFSQKSDVWAFGVTMWEIFTLAKEQPYSDMSDKQVIEDALKGKNRKILSKPDMCPLEVYKIMLECWAYNSDQRATFEELFQLLTCLP